MFLPTRVDPGYSTIGDLQAALDKIVRILLAIALREGEVYDDHQACHERVLKVLKEDGETPPNWLEYSLLCRYDMSASLALKGEQSCKTIVVQENQELRLLLHQGAGVQGWQRQGQRQDP